MNPNDMLTIIVPAILFIAGIYFQLKVKRLSGETNTNKKA